MKVIAIAAVGKNGVIGNGNKLPWNIPEDMNFFRTSTRNHIVVMGRKSFDSLGKPLPARENAVITRDASWKHDGVLVFHDLDSSIHFYKKEARFSEKTLFIIGGAEIYQLAFSVLDELWLTEVDAEFVGDVFFPFYRDGKLERSDFRQVLHEVQKDFSTTPYHYFFNRYQRIS